MYLFGDVAQAPVQHTVQRHSSGDAQTPQFGFRQNYFHGLAHLALDMTETEQAQLFHTTAMHWLGLNKFRFE